MRHEKIGWRDILYLIVGVVVIFTVLEFALGLGDFWQNIIIAWLIYKLLKTQVTPQRSGRANIIGLFDDNGETRVALGEPQGASDNFWFMGMCAGEDSKAHITLGNQGGQFSLWTQIDDGGGVGLFHSRSVDKMIELGILKPLPDRGDDDDEQTPDRPSPRVGKQNFVDTFLYVLAG